MPIRFVFISVFIFCSTTRLAQAGMPSASLNLTDVASLRQTGRLSLDVEVPILVIAIGILLLVARNKSIPIPTWVVLEEQNKEGA